MLPQITAAIAACPPAALSGLGIALTLTALAVTRRAARQRRRSLGGIDQNFLSRLRGLPAETGMLALSGARARRRETPGNLRLPTTPGLRLVTILISAGLLYVLWAQPGRVIPANPALTMAICAAIGFSLLGVFTYEARIDHDRLILTKFLVVRREYPWKDLLEISEDGQYDYVLRFRGGKKVKVMKYLVGMPRLLGLIAEILARNEALNARTARS